jgi:hypothetical protein
VSVSRKRMYLKLVNFFDTEHLLSLETKLNCVSFCSGGEGRGCCCSKTYTWQTNSKRNRERRGDGCTTDGGCTTDNSAGTGRCGCKAARTPPQSARHEQRGTSQHLFRR